MNLPGDCCCPPRRTRAAQACRSWWRMRDAVQPADTRRASFGPPWSGPDSSTERPDYFLRRQNENSWYSHQRNQGNMAQDTQVNPLTM